MANPVNIDPLGSLGQVVRTGVVCVALAMEVALVSALLIRFCAVERRAILVVTLLTLNISTFYLFIVLVLPMAGNVFFVEVAIWLTEALLILHVARSLGERPAGMGMALGLSLVGNLTSFLVGLAL